MKSFADVMAEKGVVTLRSFEQVPREDAHNIQTHAIELALLVSAVPLLSLELKINNVPSYSCKVMVG